MTYDTAKKVRLTNNEIKIIKETAKNVFGKNVKVLIFGSRASLEKKGGDIDILIKSSKQISVSDEIAFLAKLELKGIQRKVDLLTITPKTKLKKIHADAISSGVEI